MKKVVGQEACIGIALTAVVLQLHFLLYYKNVGQAFVFNFL